MDHNEFRKFYEETHPASIPKLKAELSIYPGWLQWVVLLMFVCAALLSGIHTIPTVRGGMSLDEWGWEIVNVVSFGAFVAVELVFLVAAYALMRKFSWLAVLALAAAFTVAMVANLQQNLEAYRASDPGTITVAVTLGIGAPLIAFLGGKMFVDIHKARRSLGGEAQKRLDKEEKDWDATIHREWKKHQKESSKVSPVREISPDFMNVHEKPTSPKQRVKLHEVAREVHENGDHELSATELMEKYGISLGGTTKVREIVKSMNGHGEVQS